MHTTTVKPKTTSSGQSKRSGGVAEPARQVAIQPKLTIGQPNDKYEKEADHMADMVMRMPAGPIEEEANESIQRKCNHCKEEEKARLSPITPLLQKQGEEEKKESTDEDSVQLKSSDNETPAGEEEAIVQAKGKSTGTPSAASGIESTLQSSKGGGAPLDQATRNFVEPRFGMDFSQIRIHTGSNAVQMSNQLNAQAFTHGNDIYFNSGKYDPGSSNGKHLLAHELTHTVQQTDSSKNSIQKKPKYQAKYAHAIKMNNDLHDFTPGLVWQLFVVSRKGTLYRKAMRENEIGPAFVELVKATQSKLGVPDSGILDDDTIKEGMKWLGNNPDPWKLARRIRIALHEGTLREQHQIVKMLSRMSSTYLKDLRAIYYSKYEIQIERDLKQLNNKADEIMAIAMFIKLINIADRIRLYKFDYSESEAAMMDTIKMGHQENEWAKFKAAQPGEYNKILADLLNWLSADEYFEALTYINPNPDNVEIFNRICFLVISGGSGEKIFIELLNLNPKQRADLAKLTIGTTGIKWIHIFSAQTLISSWSFDSISNILAQEEDKRLEEAMRVATLGGGTWDDLVKKIVSIIGKTNKVKNLPPAQNPFGKLLQMHYDEFDLAGSEFMMNLLGDVSKDEFISYIKEMKVSRFDQWKYELLSGNKKTFFKVFEGIAENRASVAKGGRPQEVKNLSVAIKKLMQDPTVREKADNEFSFGFFDLSYKKNQEDIARIGEYASGDLFLIRLNKVEQAIDKWDDDEFTIYNAFLAMDVEEREIWLDALNQRNTKSELAQKYKEYLKRVQNAAQRIKSDLNDDEEKIVTQILEEGKIPHDLMINWSVDGMGTHVEALHQAIGDRSKDENDRFTYRLGFYLAAGGEIAGAINRKKKGPFVTAKQVIGAKQKFDELWENLRGDLGLDDTVKALDLMLGDPTEREKEDEFGRKMASFIAHTRVKLKGFLSRITIGSYFTDSTEVVEIAEIRFLADYMESIKDGEIDSNELTNLTGRREELDVRYDKHLVEVEFVAEVAATIAGIVAGIAVSIVTAGSGATVLAALYGSLFQSATSMIAKKAMAGGHYDILNEEGLVDLSGAAVDAIASIATAGIMSKIPLNRLANIGGKSVRGLTKELAMTTMRASKGSRTDIWKRLAIKQMETTVESAISTTVNFNTWSDDDKSFWVEWAKSWGIGTLTGTVTELAAGRRVLNKWMKENDVLNIEDLHLDRKMQEVRIKRIKQLIDQGKKEEAEKLATSIAEIHHYMYVKAYKQENRNPTISKDKFKKALLNEEFFELSRKSGRSKFKKIDKVDGNLNSDNRPDQDKFRKETIESFMIPGFEIPKGYLSLFDAHHIIEYKFLEKYPEIANFLKNEIGFDVHDGDLNGFLLLSERYREIINDPSYNFDKDFPEINLWDNASRHTGRHLSKHEKFQKRVLIRIMKNYEKHGDKVKAFQEVLGLRNKFMSELAKGYRQLQNP